MAKRRTPVRYPGRLGQPTSRAAERIKATISGSDPDIWLANHRRSLIDELAEYYGIDPGASTKWRDLTLHLAFDHVPAFQYGFVPRKGRPPKDPAKRLFMQVMNDSLPKKRGAPVKWPPELCAEFVQWVDTRVKHLGLSGRGAVISACKSLVDELSRTYPKVVRAGERATSVTKLQKWYSYAKKKLIGQTKVGV
jgi:hypothetical protein